jgi:ribosomal protein L12E/L44/L45/RPP1/RPP2
MNFFVRDEEEEEEEPYFCKSHSSSIHFLFRRHIQLILEMKVISAYMLCVLGGNASPGADDIKKVLSALDIAADDAAITLFLEKLGDKVLADVITAGKAKLSKFGGGGGGGGGGSGGAAAAVEEEKEEEEEEEEVDLGGGGLFGEEAGDGDY